LAVCGSRNNLSGFAPTDSGLLAKLNRIHREKTKE
jgi:hypothetical protein